MLTGSRVINDVAISGGLFTVILNAAGAFGSNDFSGGQRRLDISVNGMLNSLQDCGYRQDTGRSSSSSGSPTSRS